MNLSIGLSITGLLFSLISLGFIISIAFYQYADDAWDYEKYGPKIRRNTKIGIGLLCAGVLLQAAGFVQR